MLKNLKCLVVAACLSFSATASADITVAMNFTDENGVGEAVGTVTISETKYGLLFTPNLQGLTPGAHGFHIHQFASCDKSGMSAGGHFDPQSAGVHLGPYNDNGHLGDLPVLQVNADGTATTPVLVPRIMHIEDVSSHALMIHHGGDNYSDEPNKLGGGGVRMVCGLM